jgi:hypothetical protein
MIILNLLELEMIFYQRQVMRMRIKLAFTPFSILNIDWSVSLFVLPSTIRRHFRLSAWLLRKRFAR